MRALSSLRKILGRCSAWRANGTVDRLHGACKLRKDAVSGRVGDPTSMLFNQLLGYHMHRPESDKCSRLIRFPSGLNTPRYPWP